MRSDPWSLRHRGAYSATVFDTGLCGLGRQSSGPVASLAVLGLRTLVVLCLPASRCEEPAHIPRRSENWSSPACGRRWWSGVRAKITCRACIIGNSEIFHVAVYTVYPHEVHTYALFGVEYATIQILMSHGITKLHAVRGICEMTRHLFREPDGTYRNL